MRHSSLITVPLVILLFLTSHCFSIPITNSVPRITQKSSQSFIHTASDKQPEVEQKFCGVPLIWVYPCNWTSDPSLSRLEKLGPVIFIKYLVHIPSNLVNSIFSPFATATRVSSNKGKGTEVQRSPRSETKSGDTHGIHSSSSSSLRVPRIFIFPTLAFKALSASPKATAAVLPINRKDLNNCPLQPKPPGKEWVRCVYAGVCSWQHGSCPPAPRVPGRDTNHPCSPHPVSTSLSLRVSGIFALPTLDLKSLAVLPSATAVAVPNVNGVQRRGHGGELGPNSCYDPRNKPYGAGFEWCEKDCQYVKKGSCPKTPAEIIMDVGRCLFPWRFCPASHSKSAAPAAAEDEKGVQGEKVVRGLQSTRGVPDTALELSAVDIQVEVESEMQTRHETTAGGDSCYDPKMRPSGNGWEWCEPICEFVQRGHCVDLKSQAHPGCDQNHPCSPTMALSARRRRPSVRSPEEGQLEIGDLVESGFQEKTPGPPIDVPPPKLGDVWCSQLGKWASYCGPIEGLPHGASASLQAPRVFIFPALAIKMLSSVPKTLAAAIPLRRSSRVWKLALQHRDNLVSVAQPGQQIWSWCGMTPLFAYPCRVEIPEHTVLCPSPLNRTQCIEKSVEKLKASVPGILCLPGLLLKTVKQVPKITVLALPSSPLHHLTSASPTAQHKFSLRDIQESDKPELDLSSLEGAAVNSTTGISKGWQWSYCMKGGFVYPCVYNVPDVYVWCSDGINRKQGTCPGDPSAAKFHLKPPGIFSLPAAVVHGLGRVKNAVGAALPKTNIKRDIGKIDSKKRDLHCEDGGYNGYPACHESAALSLRIPRIVAVPTLILKALSTLPNANAIDFSMAIADNNTQQTSFNSTQKDIACKGGGSGDNDPLHECVCTTDNCFEIDSSAGARSVTIPRLFTLPAPLLKIPGALARTCQFPRDMNGTIITRAQCCAYAGYTGNMQCKRVAGAGALSVPRVFVLPTLFFKAAAVVPGALAAAIPSLPSSSSSSEDKGEITKRAHCESGSYTGYASCQSSSSPSLSPPRIFTLPSLILSLFTPDPIKAIVIPQPEPITNSIADPNFDILRKSVDDVLAGTKRWFRRSDGKRPDNFCTSSQWKPGAACTGTAARLDVETRIKMATAGVLGLAVVFAGFL